MLDKLIQGDSVEQIIQEALMEIHVSGPMHPETFEKLAYIKKFHNDIFSKYEGKLVSLMGLFYKKNKPESLIEEVYSIYSDAIEMEIGKKFTPVQADAYKQIRDRQYFSFSAPTSAGKSYLFRELIQDTIGDIIIVVPSRALISEYFLEVLNLVDKSVLVLQFIEDVNRDKINKRIFIITPERGGDIFKYSGEFNIELFLLDEAQISEEPVRGMKFDSFVRRVDRVFPKAKKVFAHPFISNPEAQLLKHGFTKRASSKSYDLHTVGKIFISYNNGKFKFFSPYGTKFPQVDLKTDVATGVLNSNGTMLVYIAKDKIYKGQYIVDFGKYIELCQKVSEKTAIEIIEKLRNYIGASKHGTDKHSTFLDMMIKGVVIHHGSMPLKARLLIEEFIKKGFARICFATSTLNQGINMPFDLVWIDNFHNMAPLTLKNLIGRSGRSTQVKNFFDYGYTIVKSLNVATFSNRLKDVITISDSSLLDDDFDHVSDEFKDIVEAIRENSFDDELHLTRSQVDRLVVADINAEIKYILDHLMEDNVPITGKAYYETKDEVRKAIKTAFKTIYAQHLRRRELTKAEMGVLSTAIPILLWRIQGKSFSEIVSLRHAFLSEKDKRLAIFVKARRGEISAAEAKEALRELKIRYSPIASPLPNKDLRAVPLFAKGTSCVDADYDILVYDTYDYLDKVISLSLTDPICAALELYWNDTNDPRSMSLKNYIRFGTNDEVEIWLLRYGFDSEDLEWLKEHVVSINRYKITFKDTIYKEDYDRIKVVSRYI